MVALVRRRRDGHATQPPGPRQTQDNSNVARRIRPVRFLLATFKRVPPCERRGRVGRTDPSQFHRFPRLSLVGHVFRLLQPVRLLLAQQQLPQRSQNVHQRLRQEQATAAQSAAQSAAQQRRCRPSSIARGLHQ